VACRGRSSPKRGRPSGTPCARPAAHPRHREGTARPVAVAGRHGAGRRASPGGARGSRLEARRAGGRVRRRTRAARPTSPRSSPARRHLHLRARPQRQPAPPRRRAAEDGRALLRPDGAGPATTRASGTGRSSRARSRRSRQQVARRHLRARAQLGPRRGGQVRLSTNRSRNSRATRPRPRTRTPRRSAAGRAAGRWSRSRTTPLRRSVSTRRSRRNLRAADGGGVATRTHHSARARGAHRGVHLQQQLPPDRETPAPARGARRSTARVRPLQPASSVSVAVSRRLPPSTWARRAAAPRR
jgi:hypothetical protein